MPRHLVTTILAVVALTPAAFGVVYEYADTTGFTTAGFPSGTTQAFAFPGNGGPIDMSRSSVAGTGLSLEVRSVTYSGSAPFNNPDWIAGSRNFYGIRDSGTLANPTVTISGTFTSPLPTTGYLVFTDIEFGEQITVSAFNGGSLIPYSDLVFTKWNGGSSTGTSVNTTWNTQGGATGILVSGTPFGFSNPVVTLQSTQPISSFQYVIDMGPATNSLGFNFTVPVVPEPGTMALAAIAGGVAVLRLRRRRRTSRPAAAAQAMPSTSRIE